MTTGCHHDWHYPSAGHVWKHGLAYRYAECRRCGETILVHGPHAKEAPPTLYGRHTTRE